MRPIQTLPDPVKPAMMVKVEQALICIGRWTIYNAGQQVVTVQTTREGESIP